MSKFTNSTLISYKNLTKNKTTNRNHKIDTITIHCFVGQVTAKRGCDYFATTDRDCSANYVVGCDGSIGLSVEEKDRSWCSGNKENDHRAVTIEVACSTEYPYEVTDEAYKALIKLCADICARNGIKELKWRADKKLIGDIENQNVTVHRWFEATACPGDYLYSKLSAIVKDVNYLLNIANKKDIIYRVQVGAFSDRTNADNFVKKLEYDGYKAFIVETRKGN